MIRLETEIKNWICVGLYQIQIWIFVMSQKSPIFPTVWWEDAESYLTNPMLHFSHALCPFLADDFNQFNQLKLTNNYRLTNWQVSHTLAVEDGGNQSLWRTQLVQLRRFGAGFGGPGPTTMWPRSGIHAWAVEVVLNVFSLLILKLVKPISLFTVSNAENFCNAR